jgi:hypothetical protein
LPSWIRIRIQQLKLMRIHADPDPKPWFHHPVHQPYMLGFFSPTMYVLPFCPPTIYVSLFLSNNHLWSIILATNKINVYSTTLSTNQLFCPPTNHSVHQPSSCPPTNYSVRQPTILSTHQPFCPPTNHSIHQPTILSTHQPFCPPTNHSVHQPTILSTNQPFSARIPGVCRGSALW